MDRESFDPSISRPLGGGVGDEDSSESLRKKSRVDFGNDMKRVAEIVMVLSAMGDMRGGRAPSAVERKLMNEAREKLAEMCEPVAPKDLFGREDVRVVVEDLGLNNKFRDQRLGFRPPKMSIAEKLLLTKRKMEESKGFTAHSATYASQLLQRGFGANSEHHGTLFHVAHGFPPDKPIPMAMASGGFQPSSPAVNVSALASSSASLNQSQVDEVQPAITRVPSSNRILERDSSSLALPRTEAAHFRLDASSNGPAHVSQFRANLSGDHLLEKAPTSSMQFPTASVTKVGQASKMPNHSPVKVVGAHEGSAFQVVPQTKRDQKPETSSGNLHSLHQPLPGVKFAQSPTVYTNHADIGRSVQKILQLRVLDHPKWTPPSTDYMNSPLICQICKVIINDVDSLLVCDSCEKGAHLRCLHSYNQKGIPKIEWYCPKCLISSNGKPLPPKYGRVSRSINASKASSTAGGVQASSEKRVEHPDQKVNHEKIIANGNSGLQKMENASELHISNFPVTKIKMDDGAYHEACMDQSKEKAGAICVQPGTQNETSSRHLQNSESSPSGMERLNEAANNHLKNSGLSPSDMERSTPELELQPKVESGYLELSGTGVGILDRSQASCESEDNDRIQVPICAKVSANQLHCKNTYQEVQRHSDLRETSEYKLGCDVKRENHDVAQAIPDGTLDSMNGSRDCSESSLEEGLRSVDWVGDILKVVDAKTYYPSCRIDGVLYKLKDHALFHSSNQSLSPWKLQALWEDNKTKSKWAIVSQCYFPNELPEVVGRPCTPDSNEIYESNHQSTIMVGLIRGPCEVLPPEKFKEEVERRIHIGLEKNCRLHPVFLCKWFYDESKGLFRPTID